MTEILQGRRLIFIISQPRSGSTVVQRILGGHKDIHTGSEPWLMLHPLYGLRREGHEAEYNVAWAEEALHTFLQMLPGKRAEYLQAVRIMSGYLYGRALEGTGKRYFLDKTPRYYLIIPDLHAVFPEAHFIILLRNPLAVLASILKTWVGEDWFSLYNYRLDLFRAPDLLIEGMRSVGERVTVVRYEQLIENPEIEMRRICERLGIGFFPEMVEYGRNGIEHWHFGDQGNVYRHARPISDFQSSWVATLKDPQIWRLAHDYLQLLGPETVEAMGYSAEALHKALMERRPNRALLRVTWSLSWLLRKPNGNRKGWESGLVFLTRCLQQRDFRRATSSAARRVARAFGST